MDLETFNRAVVIHHRIKNLENSLRVLERREAATFTMEFNSLEAGMMVKKALAADLTSQLTAAKKELVDTLSLS